MDRISHLPGRYGMNWTLFGHTSLFTERFEVTAHQVAACVVLRGREARDASKTEMGHFQSLTYRSPRGTAAVPR